MAIIDIKVPSPGESITQVEIAQWLVEEGEYVHKDQIVCEIDSDKATLEFPIEKSGAIKLVAQEGDTVNVGDVICKVDTSAKAPKGSAPDKESKEEKKEEKSIEVEVEVASPSKAKAAPVADHAKGHPSIAAKKIMDENSINADRMNGTGKGGRITKQDVLAYMAAGFDGSAAQGWGGSRDNSEKKMSMLRRKLAQRLVSVKNETAMLTTFNEVDMSAIMDIRSRYKEKFKEEKQIGLGFMSFFTKAVTEALGEFPAVNSMIDGDHMVSYDYADVAIAVSSPKGLMVPVIRNAEQMSLAEIERSIKELAIKARDGKLTIEEMTGGTFTITNGGVFGSMLSTPIINPPQSAILGMHNIVERPVAVNGKVEIRPIMYVALSYDHRIIDGKESVSFLVKVKEMLEDPSTMIFGGKSPEEVLLGL